MKEELLAQAVTALNNLAEAIKLAAQQPEPKQRRRRAVPAAAQPEAPAAVIPFVFATAHDAELHAKFLQEIRVAGRIAPPPDKEEDADDRARRFARGKAELDGVFRRAVNAGLKEVDGKMVQTWTPAQMDALDKAHRERSKFFIPEDERPVPIGEKGGKKVGTLPERKGYEARLKLAADMGELDEILDEAGEKLWNAEDIEAINAVYNQRKVELS